MFFLKAPQARSHDGVAPQVADDLFRIATLDHRQPPNIAAKHFRGCFGERFVGICHK
jgi:hypothetical protein